MATPTGTAPVLATTGTFPRDALLELGAALLSAALVGYARASSITGAFLRKERRTARVAADVYRFALTGSGLAALLTGPTAPVAARYFGLPAIAFTGLLVALLSAAAAVARTAASIGIATLVGVANLVTETALGAPRANEVLLTAEQAVSSRGWLIIDEDAIAGATTTVGLGHAALSPATELRAALRMVGTLNSEFFA